MSLQNFQYFLRHYQKKSFNRILLIDDVVGSGSTLNEIAKQIKEKGIGNHFASLALTGSSKGLPS